MFTLRHGVVSWRKRADVAHRGGREDLVVHGWREGTAMSEAMSKAMSEAMSEAMKGENLDDG